MFLTRLNVLRNHFVKTFVGVTLIAATSTNNNFFGSATSFLSMGNAAGNSIRDNEQKMQVAKYHYVLKNNLMKPEGSDEEGWRSHDGRALKRVVFATGCYWGSEKSFWRMPGVYTTAVGAIGGTTKNPTYEQLCSGMTGHAESVQVFYDENLINFSDLLRQFLQSHDPTQGNGQGGDRGTQYRSGVWVVSEEEYELTKAVVEQYQKQIKRKITSEIVYPAPEFYYAEDYMQQYLAKPGNRQYCSAMPLEVDLVFDFTNFPKFQPKLSEKYWEKYAPVEGCVIARPGKPSPHEQIVWKYKDEM